MKRIFQVLLLVISLIVVSSCSKTIGGGETDIVGTWKSVEKIDMGGVDMGNFICIFNANGKGEEYYTLLPTSKFSFTWTYSNSSLLITVEGMEPQKIPVTWINKNQIKFTIEIFGEPLAAITMNRQ
jgi:hypothetical protein